MYGYQFYNMQLCARDNGFTPFVSMQNHYNPLYREDERELIPICKQMNVALTPYSPLASGRCARPNWDADTLRSKTDKVARGKYDSTEEADKSIAARIAELAEKYETSMTAVTFAWHFAKGVASPIVGATKAKYLDDAAGAFDLKLTAEDVAYIDDRRAVPSACGHGRAAAERRGGYAQLRTARILKGAKLSRAGGLALFVSRRRTGTGRRAPGRAGFAYG